MEMEMEAGYNIFLVALSFCVSVFGSYTALQLASGIREACGRAKALWISGAALSLGGGAIWSMHFIGMLAYETAMPVMYDPGLTFLSLGIVLLVEGFGIYIVSVGRQSIFKLLIAGVVTGSGVASMHYTGMASMVMAADMVYDSMLVTLSIAIAVVAATVALWLAFNLSGHPQKLGSALVMGVAVCGMHYTGMAAMTMVPHNKPISIESTMEPLTMGLFIFCFSMLLLVLCLTVALSQLNKRMYEELDVEVSEADPA